jgi:malonyl-CoA/methylmalonyl-CoA synthetase
MRLLTRLSEHRTRPAIVSAGRTVSFETLDDLSARVAGGLLGPRDDLEEARVAFLIQPSVAWVAVALGIWRAGGVAVPLAVSHPPAELDFVIRDTGARLVVADPQSAAAVAPLAAAAGAEFVPPNVLLSAPPQRTAPVPSDRRALILFTSGTTGQPKGVVTSHANLDAQISTLVETWEWTPEDRALLVLPLHHVHGIVNVVGCALWSGAACEVQPRFDAETTWARLASGEITVFTAVPTIYRRLIRSWDAAPSEVQEWRSAGARRARVMMSGSSALPAPTLERWREITGHTLLERYGMTEIGMILANPLHGERRPGFVGTPLPGVDVRLAAEDGSDALPGAPGEVEVRGPGVFREYWRQPDATAHAFRDGWFRTGDVAVLEDGAYRLLGRTNIDIIKTGGHKISALEIEAAVRGHPAVAECAVVGIRDEEWGERVCVAVELQPGARLSIDELQGWARTRLAPYKVPRELRSVDRLPRNAMGKVIKPDVAALFGPGAAGSTGSPGSAGAS